MLTLKRENKISEGLGHNPKMHNSLMPQSQMLKSERPTIRKSKIPRGKNSKTIILGKTNLKIL
jgi:hypothetical protein